MSQSLYKGSSSKRGTGYTLVEVMVATGLFAIIMLLAAGAYLMMIALNREAQGIASGINNLSFALETMTRNMRTGSEYSCGSFGGDCPDGASSFSFRNPQGEIVTYSLAGTALRQVVEGTESVITDPSVTITSLKFYAFGTRPVPLDYTQARVSMTVSGTVSSGPNKTQSFTVETGATMRKSDL